MLRHSDAILKIALALAALLAGGGVGFYYGIYLPAQDTRRQAHELAERQAALAAQRLALAEQAKRAEAAQAEFDDCVAFAEQSYAQRWAQSCQSLHDADRAAFEDCADDLFSTESGCLAKYPVRPARDCALPAAMARELTQAREGRKAECTARFEASQRGAGG